MNDRNRNLIAGMRAAIKVHEDFDQMPVLVTDMKRLLDLIEPRQATDEPDWQVALGRIRDLADRELSRNV